MALSNSQYDQMMRTYEQRQLDNEYQLRERYQKAYSQLPALKETDQAIASLSVEKGRRLLEGDDQALLKRRIEFSVSQKAPIIREQRVSSGFFGASVYMSGLSGHRIYRRREVPLF